MGGPPAKATPHTTTTASVAHGSFARIPAVLCSAADAARSGDAATALARFQDVHADLHALAASLSAADRAAAARVLRAKQKVEADASAPVGAPALATDLVALSRVVADAVGAPTTCGG
jgi:hypothetical protein